MKKLLYFCGAAVVTLLATCSVVSCGPSQEEIARQDSIRVAENQRIADSIKAADSIAKAQEEARLAEEKAQRLKEELNNFAASVKSDYPVKFEDLNLVAYIEPYGDADVQKNVIIRNIETGSNTTVALRESEMYGSVVGTKKKGGSQMVVTIHNGGSGPYYTNWLVDVKRGAVVKVWGD